MISRVLVPMDDSEMARHALEYALEVFPDASITVLRVVGGPSPMMGRAMGIAIADDMEESAEEYAQDVLDTARELADERDREITTEVAVGSPARAIINHADAYDTVVIGAHGGTLADRMMIGNVAETVFRQAPVPVTVVR